MSHQKVKIRYASKLQRFIKLKVDELLRSREVEALKYTRVGILIDSEGKFNLYVKIFHEKPLRYSTIQELVNQLNSIVKVDFWQIYAPHAKALKISGNIKDVLVKL